MSKGSTRKQADTLAKTEGDTAHEYDYVTMRSSHQDGLYELIAVGHDMKSDLPVANRVYDEIRSTQYEIPVKSPPTSSGVDEVQSTPADHYELIHSPKPEIPKLVRVGQPLH